MTCISCKSTNVKVEAISNVKSRGGTVPLWYYFSFLWTFDWLFFFAIYRLLKRSAKKTNTKVETYAICQDCGETWKF